MSGRRGPRCKDPSQGAPIVWVTQGRTQHMAFLLEDKGDYKKIRWASTSLSEWVESSAVANEMEGRGRRRAATSASNSIAAAAAVAVKPIKRKAAATGIQYSESKESEEEFEWDAAEEEEEEEEDVGFSIPRKRPGSSKDSVSTKSTSNSRKSKKKKRKRKRESDDESEQEFFSDEEAVAKKRPKLKRAKTEKRPSYQEPTEEEFNDKVARKEKAATAAPTSVDNKIPRKNRREYPVSARDIKAGASVAKKTKKRGWITGRIISVEKLACNVHWSTGKEDKVEWERVPKMIYDADTSHYPIGTRVRKRFPIDDIIKSGKVVSLNNSQYHILYKNQTKEVVGTSEMDQILKISARKQAAAAVEPPPAVGDTMESTPRIQTTGQNTGSEAMARKSRKQEATASSAALSYKDEKDGPVQKKAAASLGPKKSKRDTELDEPPPGSVAVGSAKSKLIRERSKKRKDSVPRLKDDAVEKTAEKKPASDRKVMDPPDDDVLDEPRNVPVSFSPTNSSSRIQLIASQLQNSSTKNLSVDLPEMEKTSTGSRAAVNPEDSVKDDSLPLPPPKLDVKAAETESDPGDAEIQTIDLTAKKFEKTPFSQKKSTLDQKDTPEILSPAMDPPTDSPVSRNEDESPVQVAEKTQATFDTSVPSAPETNTTIAVTKLAEKDVAGDAKEHSKLTPDDNNTASELKGKGKDASIDATVEKAKLVAKILKKTTIEQLQKMGADGAIESKPVEKEPSPASKMPAVSEKINTEFAGESKPDDKNSKPVSSPPLVANTASVTLPANKAFAQPKDKSDQESSAGATADEKRKKAKASQSGASDVVAPEVKSVGKTSQDVTNDKDQVSKSQLGKPKSKTDDKAESAGSVSKSDKASSAVEKAKAASKRSLPVHNKMSGSARSSVSSEVEKKKRQREKASLQRQLAGKKEQQISKVTNAQAPPGPSAHSKKRKAVQEEQPKRKRPKSDTSSMRNNASIVARQRERGTSRGQPRSLYDIMDSRKVAGQTQSSQKYFLPDLTRQAQTKRSIADVLYSRPPDRKKEVVAKPKETEKSRMASVPPQPESRKEVAKANPQGESEQRSIPTKKNTATQGFIPDGLQKNSQTQRRGQYGAQSVRPSASTGDRRSAELSTRMQAQAQTANRNASISQHHHPRASAPPHQQHGGQHGALPHQHTCQHGAPQQHHGGQHGATQQHHGGQHGAPSHQHGGGFNDGSSRTPQPPVDYATQQRIALENFIRQQNPALYQALSQPAMANWTGNNAHHPQAANSYGAAQYAYQAPAAPAQVRQQVVPAQVRQQAVPAQVRTQVAPVALLPQDRPRQAGQSDPPGDSPASRR